MQSAVQDSSSTDGSQIRGKKRKQQTPTKAKKKLELDDEARNKSYVESSSQTVDQVTISTRSNPRIEESYMSCCQLLLDDKTTFQNMMRLSPEDFRYLSALLAPELEQENPNQDGIAISPPVQVMLTLRFLVTGDTYDSIRYQYKISQTSMYQIISKVCEAIPKVLACYLRTPITDREWLEIESEFHRQWKFCHCIGAIGGRHIIVDPNVEGKANSVNTNNSDNFVFLAMIDADYNFMAVDIGNWGKPSEGGAFKGSSLYQNLSRNGLQFPQQVPLPGGHNIVPYVVVAEDAFPLNVHLMKPYHRRCGLSIKEKLFNYHIVRVRAVIENTIGIMAAVFRIFQQPIHLSMQDAKRAALACVVLHNFMRRNTTAKEIYSPKGTFDRVIKDQGFKVPLQGNWRMFDKPAGLKPLKKQGSNASVKAVKIREEFANYFHNKHIK